MKMRYNVEIKARAVNALKIIERADAPMVEKFWALAERLKEAGLALPQLVKVSGMRNGWRLRFGRYRALLTLDGSKFIVWIVFLKKDPHKEYDKWLNYIRRYADV